MKITKQDIKTLEKIKKMCGDNEDCDNCIFSTSVFCEMQEYPAAWNIGKLKAKWRGKSKKVDV